MARTGPKRNRVQREALRVEITKRLLESETQAEIAAELGINARLVQYYAETVRRRLAQASLDNLTENKARQLAHLEHLKREYWQAWRRSLQDEERTWSEIRQEGAGEAMTEVRVTRIQRFPGRGNPTFLAGIQSCIERECKILGVDAPLKVDITEQLILAAEAEGIDPQLAVEAAQRIVKGLP